MKLPSLERVFSVLKACKLVTICYNKSGATLVREVGQGRNPAALSDCQVCALFLLPLLK